MMADEGRLACEQRASALGFAGTRYAAFCAIGTSLVADGRRSQFLKDNRCAKGEVCAQGWRAACRRSAPGWGGHRRDEKQSTHQGAYTLYTARTSVLLPRLRALHDEVDGRRREREEEEEQRMATEAEGDACEGGRHKRARGRALESVEMRTVAGKSTERAATAGQWEVLSTSRWGP